MRRFFCWFSLCFVLLSGVGCGAAADGPKLPEADGKKKAQEEQETQKKAMEDAMKKIQGSPRPN